MNAEENKPIENIQNKQEIYQELPSEGNVETSDVQWCSDFGFSPSAELCVMPVEKCWLCFITSDC